MTHCRVCIFWQYAKKKTVNQISYSYSFSYSFSSSNLKLSIRELNQRCFWASHVNRKWGLFHFKAPWRYQICISKCLYYYTDDLSKNLGKTTVQKRKKHHFRLTCVAQKRLCLCSLIFDGWRQFWVLFNLIHSLVHLMEGVDKVTSE